MRELKDKPVGRYDVSIALLVYVLRLVRRVQEFIKFAGYRA